jgi:hopene-associated glycosyltransferase HpnB
MLSAAIWLYLLIARGNFYYLRPFDDDLAPRTSPATWPSVTAIVPARNEAETIAHSITSLFQQNYPGEFHIIVVDDHSEDATAQLAEQAAARPSAARHFTVKRGATLPQDWTGKLWALHQGVTIAAPAAPAYFWFTDADITHAPDTLARLVSRAENDNLDLTSLMVRLQAKTIPECLTIPAFLFFFLKLYPPKKIASATDRTAGAAGGCILLRRAALDRIGGLESIRREVIDDCALARAVKQTDGKIWMGLTRASVSMRAYKSFAEIRDMIARTAFTQLRYSTTLLAGTLLGLVLTYHAPIAVLFAPDNKTRLLAVTLWLLMSLLFLPTIRYYRLSPLWAPLLPITAAFYAYATCLSAVGYYLHRGAQWKGRSQASRAT